MVDKMKRFIISGIVLVIIIVVILVVVFATVWRNNSNYDSIFEGPTDSKLSNLAINSLNGAVTYSIPEKYQKNYLAWKDIVPEAQILIDNFDDIKREVEDIMKDYDSIPEFDKIDDKQDRLANSDNKKWKTFMFKFYDEYNEENCNKCPKTSKLLKKLPLDLAMFSIMEKGKVLVPHQGPWRGLLRMHLGIDVPDGAKITVDNEDYYWKEKELILFDDTFTHSVENPNGRRVVLFMDLKRKHIPDTFHKIAMMAGKDYFNKVNMNIEKNSTKVQ